jgi:hypothetical protein
VIRMVPGSLIFPEGSLDSRGFPELFEDSPVLRLLVSGAVLTRPTAAFWGSDPGAIRHASLTKFPRTLIH